MTKTIARDPIYRRRRYQAEIIELCVRWYLTYRLSYRDLVEMMAERGVALSHSTILRWVRRYVPEFERRWARYARPVHSSWRMDETAVSVRGGAHYLYRAVDEHGKTVDSLLCTDRSESSARAFFTRALKTHLTRWPEKVNVDGNAATHRFARRYRSLSLGVYPILSLEDARSRHGLARNLLNHGLDPATLKAAVGKHLFAVIMREWAALTRARSSSLPPVP